MTKPKLNGNCDEYISFESFWQKTYLFLRLRNYVSQIFLLCDNSAFLILTKTINAFENGVSPAVQVAFFNVVHPLFLCLNIFNFAACSPYPPLPQHSRWPRSRAQRCQSTSVLRQHEEIFLGGGAGYCPLSNGRVWFVVLFFLYVCVKVSQYETTKRRFMGEEWVNILEAKSSCNIPCENQLSTTSLGLVENKPRGCCRYFGCFGFKDTNPTSDSRNKTPSNSLFLLFFWRQIYPMGSMYGICTYI